jgi:prepilin-type N-terminal cleavage/methylation domain-containing protein
MVKRGRGAGYTLIEVMLVVAILGIMSTVGARLLLQANRFFILTKTRGDLQKEARAIMYVITRELRQAQSATIILDRQSAAQPFYSRITFTKVSGTTMSFRQNGTQLQQVVGNQTMTLSKNLSYLAFTFPRSDDMTIVSVSMTLQEAIYQGQKKALHMAAEKVRVMN